MCISNINNCLTSNRDNSDAFAFPDEVELIDHTPTDYLVTTVTPQPETTTTPIPEKPLFWRMMSHVSFRKCPRGMFKDRMGQCKYPYNYLW